LFDSARIFAAIQERIVCVHKSRKQSHAKTRGPTTAERPQKMNRVVIRLALH